MTELNNNGLLTSLQTTGKGPHGIEGLDEITAADCLEASDSYNRKRGSGKTLLSMSSSCRVQ